MKDSIVLCPAPGMGHIISMVELAKLILLHYQNPFSIVILVISCDFLDTPSISSYINSISQSFPSISFRRFPPISVDPNPPRSRPAMAFDSISLHRPYVLQSLQEILKSSNVCAFIIDLFCTFALSVGNELKIPTYYFFTSGAACLGAFLYIPSIHGRYSESFKKLTDTVIDFPCMPPLKAIHMPEPFLDRDDPAYNYIIHFCSSLIKADGIIVNTFYDLEPKAIKIISDGNFLGDSMSTPVSEGKSVGDFPTHPTYYIGPLLASGSSVRAQHECLSWLDQQPKRSVVFLCFGSRGSLPINQVREMAVGLEKSGEKFLWVVKNPPYDDQRKQTADIGDVDLDAMLPEGYLSRVTDRGIIVKSWAPQIAVLNHDSVGGFVTHCGWNSVLEAVVAGVPMIAWPLYAEQHLNRNVLVEDMEIAIPVEQREEDGFVTGTELEKRVRELMESKKGEELKEKSWKMRESSLSACLEGGSSVRDLSKLVEKWKKSR